MLKTTCRLCTAEAHYQFELLVLGKHQVNYFKCSGCGALQTEEPYWLDEAYGKDAEIFDTGKASRTLENFLAFPALLRTIGVTEADISVDFGGGTGLFARLMRDVGYSFYSCDKYGSGEFISAYHWNAPGRKASLITLFEVAEHFTRPKNDWQEIFAMDPDWVIGSTSIYQGQGAEWDYLIPQSGQHVFFYSFTAIAHLAQKFGRYGYRVGSFFLITRVPLSEAVTAGLGDWVANMKELQRGTFDSWLNNPYQFAARDCRDIVNRFDRALRQESQKSFQPLIAIDAVFFQIYATGIARLWKSLLEEWAGTDFANHLVILDRNRTAPRMEGLRYLDITAHQYEDTPKDRLMLQDVCTRLKVSVFISTYYTTPITTPSVFMAYDMIPEVLGADPNIPMWREKHDAIRHAGKFISISKNTARDLVRFFPHISPMDISIAHCGTRFITPDLATINGFKQSHGITRPYFILSSPSNGYKNALLFFRAFELFGKERDRYAILCTGQSQSLPAEFLKYVGDAQLHTLLLSDEELQSAYAGALALVYPSLYEGFGMPVIEAMACSCPVITCKTSSIPEVAGNAALYVPTDNPGKLLKALTEIQSPAIRRKFIRKGLERAGQFSWKRMAAEVAALLDASAAARAESKRS